MLIVNDLVVYGGDSFYSYKGIIESDRVVINLFKHTYTAHSFFGDHDKIELNLTFHSEAAGYLLKGNVQNLQTVSLVVKAKFIDQLP